MTQDINTLILWIRVVLIIAAICATSVPVIYSFSRWRTRLFGKLFMLQAVSFAVLLDASVLFQFWHSKDVITIIVTDGIILTLVAISTIALTIMIWRMNFPKGSKERRRYQSRHASK